MANNENLFSSLVSDIKNYNGTDPLVPWLRGIKKMTDALPPELLTQKLPRFLQKCAQTFQTDRRYRNDSRYLRVWIKLLDFVDDPGAVLKNMKANDIGNKRSLFYQAYALYYEKKKKFTEAENMYHLGVQNLAEPADELQKAYDQFLVRMLRHKQKRIQRHERRSTGNLLVDDVKHTTENVLVESKSQQIKDKKQIPQSTGCGVDGHAGENTVVVRFAKTAIVGKSQAEDARHHGLVEPIINTKEAMNAINSMFCEPLGPEHFPKYNSRKNKENGGNCSNDGFKVFNDGDSGSMVKESNNKQPAEEPFQIYCDDDDDNDEDEKDKLNQRMASNKKKAAFVFPCPKDTPVESKINDEDEKDKLNQRMASNKTKAAFVFPCPKDTPVESKISDSVRNPQAKFREDTVVFRFVGSTISDEPKVENVCHHGLVEPTVNLKEAMDDINGMFGKPIEFVRKRRPRKQEKPFEEKHNCSSFMILPDDEMDHHQQKISKPSTSRSRKEKDLFEQTICTKEAMDDINKMFAMPLDF